MLSVTYPDKFSQKRNIDVAYFHERRKRDRRSGRRCACGRLYREFDLLLRLLTALLSRVTAVADFLHRLMR
jgi:hypothetical protein